MFEWFTLILATVITLVMLVPFGFLTMYTVIAIRQLTIGNKEESGIKKQSARRTLLLTITGMLLLLFIWLVVMQKL